ncbi:MAG: phosphate acetyltransferase [Actinomycetia bacterium]|nr:phosphate acetyltransferase [Actinomycetes bacterium]
MSNFLDSIMARAASEPKTIVLPEGDDPRILAAAVQAQEAGIARPVVLASAAAQAASPVDLQGITVIDPANAAQNAAYTEQLYALRQAKGLSLEGARDLLRDELYFGVMMVKTGDADGLVAGAAHATADTLRPALQILKTRPGVALVSSFFVMVLPHSELGAQGALIFADCGLVQYPDSQQLANIAISAAQSCQSLLGAAPRVALLSHSSYGSAQGASVDKVRTAVELAHAAAPELVLDGELQLDAALVPAVAAIKAPGSPLAGAANVLIFPDLDSGNIAYKLTERLAQSEAYGPITQGLAAPVNDLSRGASVEDIVGVIAITVVQAQG